MIKLLEDEEYIKNIIESKEKREEYGFDNDDIIDFLSFIRDKKLMMDCVKTLKKEQRTNEYNKNIELPENMTIGIEIESEGRCSKRILKLTNIIEEKWECKIETSVPEGVEVVSPILTGNNEKNSQEIKNVCETLKILRTNCNRRMWSTCTYRGRLFNNKRKLD